MREERSIEDASKIMHMIRVQAELIAATALENQVEDLEKVVARVPTHFTKLGELKKAA